MLDLSEYTEHKSWDDLEPREQQFILNFIKTGNIVKSYVGAGYGGDVRNSGTRLAAAKLKNRPDIEYNIREKMKEIESEKIAEGTEVLEYLTKVMRGQVRDAFGLDVTVSERTRAAIEIAKRTLDIDNKVKDEKDINVKLSWED